MSKDQITAFVVGVAFVTVVFFAGVAKGELTIKRAATNDLLSRDHVLMTVSECLGLVGKNSRGK